MECGVDDAICLFLTWFIENERGASGLADFLARIGLQADGVVKAIATFFRDYGQAFFGALGVTFGVWRYWRYREKVLHKRLDKYIGNRITKLKGAREQVLETMQRPGPGILPDAPMFIDKELRSVLRERNWDRTPLALTVETSADVQLSNAIERITAKLRTAEHEATGLRQELCTALSLRGAVAASKSRRAHDRSNLTTALSHFRSALQLPGHGGDVLLLELEAHQLRKLGSTNAATDAYKRAYDLAETITDTRVRHLTRARAKRYLAELETLNARRNAYEMLTAPLDGGMRSPGAIALFDECHPLTDWERAEKGDMHYLAAFLANELGFVVATPSHLNEAFAAYDEVVQQSGPKTWLRRLRAHHRAEQGLQRVREARRTGTYDSTWLDLPQNGQTPATQVSAAGSN